ncbi:MAG: hypothetical protein OEY11_08335 [Gammaproteobacteria bacterium]|nr:hypothetical protein [Gammaproteobacteria bacterium]
MKFKKYVFVIFMSTIINSAIAETNEVTIVQFSEREQGIEPYSVRYMVAEDLLRIDDNSDDGDFILYDDKKRIIYSVNHDDSTVLIIQHKDWKLPDFAFPRNVSWKVLEGAPEINNKPVYSYWLSAGKTVCSEAQVAKGFLMRESAMLKRYKQTLSAGQVEAIVATPEEMRTPCLLIDQVYNIGSVYENGFPLQQWHLNGLQRVMSSYKTDEKVSAQLFKLPENYKRYSMGDNLSFGERE